MPFCTGAAAITILHSVTVLAWKKYVTTGIEYSFKRNRERAGLPLTHRASLKTENRTWENCIKSYTK